MEAFTFDTSGFVPDTNPLSGRSRYHWTDLSPFVQGTLEAAARELYERLLTVGWTKAEASAAVAFSRWSPDALALILRDCERYCEHHEISGLTAVAGRAYWDNRQHGLYLVTSPPLHHFLNDAGKVCMR